MEGADHREIGSVKLDIVCAGDGRVKRTIYPAGFRWSRDMKLVSGTELCQHAHVGFLGSAMSPGIVTTATPLRETAVWMAISRTRGICSGSEIAWQYNCIPRRGVPG